MAAFAKRLLMRIPFLVPTLLALSLMARLVFIFGFSERIILPSVCVLFGYLVAVFSIFKAPTWWFRMVVSLSHSFVIAYLVVASLMGVFDMHRTVPLFFEMASLYPITAFAIAISIWIFEKGMRMTRFSKRLDIRV